MAKRSQEQSPCYDVDNQKGCVWTFISIFDFRNGRSARRLVSGIKRYHSGRHQPQNVGIGDFKAKLEMLTNPNEEIQPISNCDEIEGKMSVKELMEKEMFSEECQNKLMGSDDMYRRLHKRSRTRSCSSFGSRSLNFQEEKLPKGSLDLDEVMNDIRSQIRQERFINGLEANSDDMEEAIKTYVTDQIINGNPIRKRRSQSLEEILLKEDEKRRNATTQFSFTEIKRKLKHAMTKDRSGEKFEKSWPIKSISRDYNERYAMPSRGDEMPSRVGENEKYTTPSMSDDEDEKLKEERANDFYDKARKNLSRTIRRNGDEGDHCSSSRRSLGIVLSETIEEMKNKSLSNFDDLIHEQKLENHQDGMEIVITADEEEAPCQLKAGFESNCRMGSLNRGKNELLFPSPLPPSTPTLPRFSKNFEHGECSKDRSEPSPVSVLESIFGEDNISPESTHTPIPAGDRGLQPRQIHFEEPYQAIHIRNDEDEEESAFEYVEAVLLASDLKWEEFLLRWAASVPILDQLLFHEVEFFSNRSLDDQRLLFDCTNEVLNELCSRYFSYSHGHLVLKDTIRPAPTGRALVDEIWEGVERHLSHPTDCVLEEMVRRDVMGKADKEIWMNFLCGREGISAEIGETILEELIDEILEDLTKEV